MTSWQKAIQYAARAFAIFLTVGIIGGMLGIFSAVTELLENDGNVLDEMKSYEITDAVTELDLEVKAADLSIITGKELRVESNLKNLSVKERAGKLMIQDQTHNWTGSDGRGKLVLTVPEDFVFDEAEISTGAGEVVIERFRSDALTMELGAGRADIQNLHVKTKTNIDGGVGEIAVKNSKLHDLDFDIGVGEVNFEAAVLGKSEIRTGIGEANITLSGTKEDYEIRIDQGLGGVMVDGQRLHGDSKCGSGENKVVIDVGVGSVRVDFDGWSLVMPAFGESVRFPTVNSMQT